MKKRLLAILLTICMVFSICPSVALAIGEPDSITPTNKTINTYEITDEQLN